MTRAARRITHLLHAWPPQAQQTEVAAVVVHVRGGERLQREIDELKARGFKVCVVPIAANDSEWWA